MLSIQIHVSTMMIMHTEEARINANRETLKHDVVFFAFFLYVVNVFGVAFQT